MRFAAPWVLILLVIPLLLFVRFRRRQGAAARFSSVELVRAAGRSRRQQLIHLPLLLRTAALILLVFGLARPQQGIEKIYDINHGIAMEMVIDRSSSMGEVMSVGSRELNRLEVVKQVFGEFVNGNNEGLAGRPNDLIGIVTFARFPETVCPLTLSHDVLNGFIEHVHLVKRRDEDGTSIGDGISLAVARLLRAEETLRRARQDKPAGDVYEIKSKVIILLTDGAHNAGNRTPEEAAELARRAGIKIYTIGIGEEVDLEGIRGFFARLGNVGRGVDKETLARISETTGGLFRMASDVGGLRSIYREIDALEKSEIESVRHLDYAEYFPYFVLPALGLILLEFFLRCTLLRRIP